MTTKILKKHQLEFLEEVCTTSCRTKKGRKLNSEREAKMGTTRSKKAKFSLQRPSQYPVPRGLFIEF